MPAASAPGPALEPAGRSRAPAPAGGPPSFPGGPSPFLLPLIVVFGEWLRLASAGTSGLWRDEALFLFVSRMESLPELLRYLRLHESHPPGYYLLLRWWGAGFGHSEAGAMALSLGLGVALMPLVFVVGSRLFGRREGLTAAAIVALAPPMIQVSTLVRPYAWLTVLSTAAAYLLWRCLRGGSAAAWFAYAGVMLLMLLTHNWTLLVAGAHGVIGWAWILTRPGPHRGPLRRRWLTTFLLVGLVYLLWLPTLWYQFRHAGHLPVGGFRLATLVQISKGLLGVSPAVAVVLLAVVGYFGWRASPRAGRASHAEGPAPATVICLGVPGVALGAAVLLSRTSNLLLPWCIAIVGPLAILAVARLLVWTHGTGARAAALAGGAALLVACGLAWQSQAGHIKSNAREIAAFVTRRGRPDDLVVITPQTLASSFNFYFTADNPQMDFPAMGRREIVEFDDRAEEMASQESFLRARARLDAARAAGRRVWLVMEASSVDDDLALPDARDEGTQREYRRLALKRSNQLRLRLIHLYGEPSLVTAPPPGREGLELLAAFLFESAPGMASARAAAP